MASKDSTLNTIQKTWWQSVNRWISAEQIPMLVVRDRHGETTDYVLPSVNAQQIELMFNQLINKYE